jgi:hypothetical protein
LVAKDEARRIAANIFPKLPGKPVWLSFRMMPQGGNWGAPSVMAALAGLVQD